MLQKRWDKSKLPSRHVTVGPDRAPHRSYYYAMGLTEDEIDAPFVGVKHSGHGAEDGPEGLESYLVTKAIHEE